MQSLVWVKVYQLRTPKGFVYLAFSRPTVCRRASTPLFKFPLLGSSLLEFVQSSLCVCVMLHQQAVGHIRLGQNRKSCISLGGQKPPVCFQLLLSYLFIYLKVPPVLMLIVGQ